MKNFWKCYIAITLSINKFNNYLDEALNIYQHYDFIISFENNINFNGYITEKLLLPLLLSYPWTSLRLK